jgi:hypothetical protein
MTEPLNRLTPELERAFHDAVCACRDWTHDPDEEPQVYINPDRITRHKVSTVCEIILVSENGSLPRNTLDVLYRIPDDTRRDLKRLLDSDESYHMAAHCLLEVIKSKRRRFKWHPAWSSAGL